MPVLKLDNYTRRVAYMWEGIANLQYSYKLLYVKNI
jgi:hypothetical protein